MRWKIYYSGATFSDLDGSAYDAPARDCQMIACSDQDHGWYLCRSDHYYWYLPDSDLWQGGDMFGLFDYLIEPGQKRVLFGRTISNDEFQAVLSLATNDPDLPQKTAWRPGERREG